MRMIDGYHKARSLYATLPCAFPRYTFPARTLEREAESRNAVLFCALTPPPSSNDVRLVSVRLWRTRAGPLHAGMLFQNIHARARAHTHTQRGGNGESATEWTRDAFIYLPTARLCALLWCAGVQMCREAKILRNSLVESSGITPRRR